MHREGHYGAALVAYAPLGAVAVLLGAETVALAGAVAAVGLAMVPDYDQRVPGLAHRGPTHTVWFALAVGLVAGGVGGWVGSSSHPAATAGLAAFGFLVGTGTILSHIAADALTPMGVRPFAPLDGRHVSLDLVRAANPVANYALLVLGMAVAAGGYAAATSV